MLRKTVLRDQLSNLHVGHNLEVGEESGHR